MQKEAQVMDSKSSVRGQDDDAQRSAHSTTIIGNNEIRTKDEINATSTLRVGGWKMLRVDDTRENKCKLYDYQFDFA